MTNGELFIAENPNIEIKLNGSCVWIYFDGVNHYTMPISWWEQEITLFDKIIAEIEQVKEITIEDIILNDRKELINFVHGLNQSLVIIDKYRESEVIK